MSPSEDTSAGGRIGHVRSWRRPPSTHSGDPGRRRRLDASPSWPTTPRHLWRGPPFSFEHFEFSPCYPPPTTVRADCRDSFVSLHRLGRAAATTVAVSHHSDLLNMAATPLQDRRLLRQQAHRRGGVGRGRPARDSAPLRLEEVEGARSVRLDVPGLPRRVPALLGERPSPANPAPSGTPPSSTRRLACWWSTVSSG
jgi:hypothetical protein